MAVEEGRALPLGKAVLAGVAVEQADVILFAVACADGKIAGVAPRVESTVRVLATEASEVIPGKNRSPLWIGGEIKGFRPMWHSFYVASRLSVH